MLVLLRALLTTSVVMGETELRCFHVLLFSSFSVEEHLQSTCFLSSPFVPRHLNQIILICNQHCVSVKLKDEVFLACNLCVDVCEDLYASIGSLGALTSTSELSIPLQLHINFK